MLKFNLTSRGGSVIRFLSLVFLFTTFLFSYTEPNTGWSYLQSDQQAFYIFIDSMNMTDEDGNSILGFGDGSGPFSPNSDCNQNPSECDVVGAFLSHDISEDECINTAGGEYSNGECDVCVGWIYYNSYSGNDFYSYEIWRTDIESIDIESLENTGEKLVEITTQSQGSFEDISSIGSEKSFYYFIRVNNNYGDTIESNIIEGDTTL